MNIVFLSVLSGCSVFLFFLVVSVMLYEKRPVNRFTDKEDWLLANFTKKVYNLFFEGESIEKACKTMYINVEEVDRYCKILHETPDYMHMVALRIIGVFVIIVCSIAGILSHIAFLVIGITSGVFMMFYPIVMLKSRAMEKRSELESEVPRFLDLLQTALYLNVPVEQAILLTSKNLKGVLPSELTESIAKTQLTVDGWQSVLQELALLYDVDVFTELVLDMITSYDKGVSIADAVARKAKDIRQTHLLLIKERASKSTSTILAPVVIFKIVPMLAFLCIPMITQINNGF